MLYRDIRFNLGSATDIMGAVGTVTGATFNKDKKGWALQTGQSKYVQYDKQLLPDEAFSIVIWISLNSGNLGLRINSVSDNSFTNTICPRYSSGYPYLGLGSSNSRAWNYTKYDNKYHCYIFSCNGSSQLDINNSTLFIDNLIQPILSTTNSSVQSSRNIFKFIGGGNSLIISNISRIKVYDHVLTSKEREKEQIEFEAAQPLIYQKRQLQLPKPTELKQQGLIAAYNKIRSGLYNDLSVSGKHGVVTNCLNTVKGIRLHGVNSKVVLGNIGNVKSISFRIKLKTTTQPILEKASNSGLIHVSSGTLTAADFANKYINGVAGTTITANQWHNITLTSSTDVNFSAATLGLNNTTYGNFEIEDLRFYSTTLSTQEIKAYHNSFNEIILQESFNDMAVGRNKLPSGWIKNGGSFVCEESTTNDTVIKSIRKGTKYLRCVTAGIVAIPSKWVNGTIKNNIYKAGNTVNDWLFTSTVIGAFNATGQNGYLLRWDTDNKFKLYKITNGVLSAALITSTNTYTPAWYEPTVTRTTSGLFTVYINGVSIGTATDTTFNISNYNQHSCIANDRITNINIQSQIKA